ncbi:MAG TPA: hypothetical protein VNG71_07700 [Pyrinomonadaceae bacterium]|nr:hypothetical protein [Pyrinomonadaceae bacterium]
MQDDLTLIAGRSVDSLRAFSGWTNIRVSRSIERMPSDFEIEMTELTPGEADQLTVEPGDICEVRLGEDIVTTGYIDRVIPHYAAGEHSIRVIGRGKCQDLVDCAAIWPGGQISNSTLLGMAQKLCEPYGIRAIAANDPGTIVEQFNLNLGESTFDIIEKVARYQAKLVYELPTGDLLISDVGVETHASGVVEGSNVEEGTYIWAIDQRYSEYLAIRMSIAPYKEVSDEEANIISIARDPEVLRLRRRIIVSEPGTGGADIAQRRAYWDAAARSGRGHAVRVRVDSWRDRDGKLWQPNWLVPLELPNLKVGRVTWLIAEVDYGRDDKGTHAELIVMPREGFLPEPLRPPIAIAEIKPVGAPQ